MPLKKKNAKPRKVSKKKPPARKQIKKIKRAANGKTAKRPASKKIRVKKRALKTEGTMVGTVTHYFPHVMAAVIKLKSPLAVGDTIKIKGHTTDLTQNVTSIQMDHAPISLTKKGQEIGLEVNSRVRQHDIVFKL